MQKQLSSARQKVRSDRITSSSANLALSTAVAAPRFKDVWLRFVPLKVGGVSVDDFGDTFDDFRNLRKTKVSIDLSHTGVQVVQKLIAEFDELKHLSALTADQILDLVSMFDDHSRNSNFLCDFHSVRDEPIKFEKRFGATDDEVHVFLIFPLTIEERLLRTVPRVDTKPLLWLDVDGVVNGSVGTDGDQQTVEVFSEFLDRAYVSFSPQIVRELNRLSQICDVHWATMWGKYARFRLAPAIGLNDFGVWRGKGTLEDVINFDRPVIWLDDYLDDEAWEGEWIREKRVPDVKAAFKHHLLIGPRRNEANPRHGHGLTMRHIEQIDAFLAKHLPPGT